MIRMVCAAAAAALLSMTAVSASAAGEFRLTINGVRSDSGSVRVAVYRTADGFPTKEGLYRSFVAPARQGTVEAVFRGLRPGYYGVVAFHDENDNDEFDTTLLGFPAEGFGFGNDAPVQLAAPSFREAAVSVGGDDVRDALTLRYW